MEAVGGGSIIYESSIGLVSGDAALRGHGGIPRPLELFFFDNTT